MTYKISILSDPLIGNKQQELNKYDHTNIALSQTSDVVLIPGNITQSGTQDQLNIFREQYYKKICDLGKIPLYTVRGPHDLVSVNKQSSLVRTLNCLCCFNSYDSVIESNYSIDDQIRQWYGGTWYRRELLKHLLVLYAFDIRVTLEQVTFFASVMKRDIDDGAKIIIMCNSKSNSYDPILPLSIVKSDIGPNDILFIAEGNSDQSKVYVGPNGIPCANASGDKIIIASIDKKNISVDWDTFSAQ